MMSWIKSVVVLFSLVVGLCPTPTTGVERCIPGTFMLTLPSGQVECELCSEGTFISENYHTHRECFNCTRIDDPDLEILIEPCSRTQDSKIQCVEGYYRILPRNLYEKGKCVKCRTCTYPLYQIHPCQPYSNTVCCSGENHVHATNSDGILDCQEKPWLCRRGHYFDLSFFQCKPCPRYTFMPVDYHTMTECLSCQNPSEDYLPLHTVVAHECNSTHQAVLECKEGYFVNHSMGIERKDIGCSPCTNCSAGDELSHEGRKCEQFHDTVCCPKPNMTVVDSPDGPTCQETQAVSPAVQTLLEAEIKTCGQNEYLYINASNSTTICKPCLNGNYIIEVNHTKTSCKDCRDFQRSQLPPACPAEETNCTQSNGWSLSPQTVIVIVFGSSALLLFVAVQVICIHFYFEIDSDLDLCPGIGRVTVCGDGIMRNPCVNPSTGKRHSQDMQEETETHALQTRVNGQNEQTGNTSAVEEDQEGENSALLKAGNQTYNVGQGDEAVKGPEPQSMELLKTSGSSML